MASQWYLNELGQVLGPFSSRELREMVERGRIDVDDFVRMGQDGKWVEAKKVTGLFPISAEPESSANSVNSAPINTRYFEGPNQNAAQVKEPPGTIEAVPLHLASSPANVGGTLFRVQGHDRTGRKREILIDASTESQALQKAAVEDVTVTKIEALPPLSAAQNSSASPLSKYPAIGCQIVILRVLGLFTAITLPIAAVVVGWTMNVGVVAALVLVSLVLGVSQLAFAELLGLLSRLHTNSQHICASLDALIHDKQSKRQEH